MAAIVTGQPSSGKSTLIAAKAISLLKAGTPASAIAVVAYSDQAAHRLRSMIASSFPTGAAVLWCATQTALAFEVVACHAERAGLPFNFGVLDPTAAIALLKRNSAGLPQNARGDLRRLAAALSRRRKGSDSEGGTPDHVLDVVEALYAQGKQQGGVADRDDLFATARELVGDASGVCRRLAKRFQYVLVDDLQDLRRETIEIIAHMSRAGSRVFGTGNTMGSIRAFDGACANAIKSFQTTLQAACFDLDRHEASSPVPRKPRFTLKQGARPKGSNNSTPLAEGIRSLAMQGIDLRDQAVLVRSNARAKALARDLKSVDIPVLHFGEFAERREVLDLCAIASLEDRDLDVAKWALERLIKLPPYRAFKSDAAKLLAIAKRRHTHTLAALRTDVTRAPLSPQGRIGLTTLAAHMRDLSPRASTWMALSVWLLERSNYLRTLDDARSAEAALARLAIVHTLSVCESQDALGETGGASLLARLKVAGAIDGIGGLATVDIGSYDVDAVRIMTVHAAQGQHFAAVHLPMTRADRSARSTGKRIKEDAMLRIALSRAKSWCLPVSSSSKSDLTWPAKSTTASKTGEAWRFTPTPHSPNPAKNRTRRPTDGAPALGV